MSNQKTIVQRIQAIDSWIEPQRQAERNVPKADHDSSFYHASTLLYTLSNTVLHLNDLLNEAPFRPLRAIKDEDAFRSAIIADFLLPRFEEWASGNCTAQQLVEKVFEFCKNRVMDGGLTRLNFTSPLQNAVNTWTNNVYCEIIKTINRSVVSLEEARERERGLAGKKKGKAKA